MYREDRDNADVIAGMLFTHVISYFALIDIGSTHSYVSSIVSVKLSVFP